MPDKVPWSALRVLAALLPLALGGGCTPTPAPQVPSQAGDEKATPSVRVVSPERAVIRREVSQPGTVEAYEETPLFAKIAGYVKKWNVDIDDPVREGQILARLSVPELEVELEQKEALIRQADEEVGQAQKAASAAEAAYHSAEAQIAEAEAGTERATAERKRTRSQHERMARAGQGGAIDRESIEEARLGWEAAEAALRQTNARVQSARALRDENKARWDRARADVRVAEARRDVAHKDRDYVKARVQYLSVTAPYDGMVTARHVNTGDFVPAATTDTGKPLYVVRRTDRLRVAVEVPEADADWIRKDVAATIRIQALRNETPTGRVARTSWSLDATARTLRAEIDLPNPGGRLRPGTYVYATLRADSPMVLTLPRSAVATEGDVTRGYQTYCYEMEDGAVRRLLIEPGPGDRERVEVRKKQAREGGAWVDFTGDEKIVSGSLAELRSGQAVSVEAAP